MTTRIEPLASPYDLEVEQQLTAMMPPNTPPILLFRTFVKNLPMTRAMSGWGSYELGRELSLSMRHREIVIDRTAVRCGCEYEWSVHTAFFAERVGLDDRQVASLIDGSPSDQCWTEDSDRILIEVVDQLHESANVSDSLFTRARGVFNEAQILDLFLLCGWYHAISFAANGARVPLEEGFPRFADFVSRLEPSTPTAD